MWCDDDGYQQAKSQPAKPNGVDLNTPVGKLCEIRAMYIFGEYVIKHKQHIFKFRVIIAD